MMPAALFLILGLTFYEELYSRDKQVGTAALSFLEFLEHLKSPFVGKKKILSTFLLRCTPAFIHTGLEETPPFGGRNVGNCQPASSLEANFVYVPDLGTVPSHIQSQVLLVH